jgi:hypothetical protein
VEAAVVLTAQTAATETLPAANTGGGGGGVRSRHDPQPFTAGAGGSGVVIVRYTTFRCWMADVAHFAELDDTNTVLRVIVVNNDDCP